jgi:hypothetical protein
MITVDGLKLAKVKKIIRDRAKLTEELGGWKANYASLEELHFCGSMLVELGLMTREEVIEIIRPLAHHVEAEESYCGPEDIDYDVTEWLAEHSAGSPTPQIQSTPTS